MAGVLAQAGTAAPGRAAGGSPETALDWEPPRGEVFVLYLAPDGRDANSGLLPEELLLTLGRASEIVRAEEPESEVEIRIAPGRYDNQRVTWRRTHPEYRTVFTRWPHHASDRPVFDGCPPEGDCRGGTWFQMSIFANTFSGTEPTNLEFVHLEVRNYQTAIVITGEMTGSGR